MRGWCEEPSGDCKGAEFDALGAEVGDLAKHVLSPHAAQFTVGGATGGLSLRIERAMDQHRPIFCQSKSGVEVGPRLVVHPGLSAFASDIAPAEG